MSHLPPPGALSWADLATPDPAAAAHFYGQLLGWRIQAPATQDDAAYRLASAGATPVAGILAGTDGQGGAAWSCYFTVADADAAAAHCIALGGAVVLPAVQIPTIGRMAVLRDPQGATFAVIQYDAPAVP